jgi:hypothetical protein
MAIALLRVYRAFVRYSGWIALGGVVLFLVYGLKFLQFSGALGDADPQNTPRAEVRSAKPANCSLFGRANAQPFNVEISCLEVHLSPLGPGEGEVPSRIYVSKNHAGDVSAGDRVYVAYARSLDSHMIINASGPAGFWWEKEAPLYLALSGFLLLVLSLIVRFRATPDTPPRAEEAHKTGGSEQDPA